VFLRSGHASLLRDGVSTWETWVDESEGDVPADAHPMASSDAMARAAALWTLFDSESAHWLVSVS
jgi:hypothetical protein